MGEVIFGLIFISAMYMIFGTLTVKYVFKFFCYALSLLEMLVIAFYIYALAAGAQYAFILQVNFYVFLGVGMFVGLVSMWNHVIELVRVDKGDEVTQGQFGYFWNDKKRKY